MPMLRSRCCKFEVGYLPPSTGYCYECRTVHEHTHLDLRALRQTLLVRVGERHLINWEELAQDRAKLASAGEGDFCQTLLTDLEGLCAHGQPVSFEGQPLKVMTCYKSTSLSAGLDFTMDLCDRPKAPLSDIVPQDFHQLVPIVEQSAAEFERGDILRYELASVSFAKV